MLPDALESNLKSTLPDAEFAATVALPTPPLKLT
jgi:hypothetical protein